ncbi:hypothetical protein PMAYCL1PPCAC_16533 [Pristionchus mayeri]|uniref:Nuclear receptor domain-containing protein n=1 Tax=Pristionchus mayeri TaxID=1317129 RepID=A0AAN5CKY3_9BILA|nr:hypothetical protein PMAYCL1PPCAC_16533 [Pristionchus mayeri]
MECLICADSITHARMGVNACRACAAFYKRTNTEFGKLKCKGGEDNCREKNPKTTCRKCRLTRFREVLEKAREKSTDEDEKVSSQALFTVNKTKMPPNFPALYDCEPSTSRTPLLDRLRKGYSLMCLIRYSGEIANRSKGDKQTEIRIGKLVLVRASYSTILHHTKLCREGVKAFANQAFDDFRELDDESKEFIIETVRGCCGTLDGAYRAAHHFPNKDDV